MTDPALVEKKLAQIETYVSELRRLARPAELEQDVRERRFVERCNSRFRPRSTCMTMLIWRSCETSSRAISTI